MAIAWRISIQEYQQPELDAQLVAENIASQIERRISYKRAMKQAILRTNASPASHELKKVPALI